MSSSSNSNKEKWEVVETFPEKMSKLRQTISNTRVTVSDVVSKTKGKMDDVSNKIKQYTGPYFNPSTLLIPTFTLLGGFFFRKHNIRMFLGGAFGFALSFIYLYPDVSFKYGSKAFDKTQEVSKKTFNRIKDSINNPPTSK